ncbi:unnamed protein product [Caenorhabditis auriculariae]|uniref:Uncharacterized protein n=1 Tax=Caenorhabditis auriculariae TaxID=2777116 RepID=A0A8S1GX35_9PELO|nr:unnamed protein product [Caenorhabditis auriculariae]
MAREDVDYPPNCQPISSTASSHEIVKKLKILLENLHEIPPNHECGSPTRYLKLFHHMSQNSFLSIANKDVQIYLACCLANILRIFSPELPSSDPRNLKEQYHFILRVLKDLGETRPDSPMFKRFHYLLELIHAAKLMHAVNEMGDESSVVYRSLLKSVLQIPTGKGWKKPQNAAKKDIAKEETDQVLNEGDNETEDDERDVYDKIKEMLVDLSCRTIHEMDQVSNSVLDVIFFYLIKPQKLQCVESSELALIILKKSKIHLEPSIHAVLEQAVMAGELPSEFEMTGSGCRSKLFEVIRELHDISADFVSTVVPFLPKLLQAEDENHREHATRLIGMMARSPRSKFRDTSVKIREECTRRSTDILMNHAQLRGQISGYLERLIHDSEESVRGLAIQVITDTAKVRLEAISEQLITACCERMLDKKPKVRAEAIKRLLSLFYHVVSNCGLNGKYTSSDREAVFLIPQKTLNVYKMASRSSTMEDTKVMIERYFQLYMIPYKMDVNERIKLMSDLYTRLDPTSVQSFSDIVSKSSAIRRSLRELLETIAKTDLDREKKTAIVQQRIRRLSSFFAEPQTLVTALKGFVNQLSSDQKSFELLEYVVTNNYTTEKMETVASELLTRIVQLKTVATLSSGPGQALRRFIDRCTPLSMDNQAALVLMNKVLDVVKDAECLHKESLEMLPSHLKLLKQWTENFPHLFSDEDVIGKFRHMLKSDEPIIVEAAMDSLIATMNHSAFRQKFLDVPWSKELCDEIVALVETDSKGFGRSCKLGVRLICLLAGRDNSANVLNNIIEKLLERIDIEDEASPNSFQALTEIFRAYPDKYFYKVIGILNDKRKLGLGFMLSTKRDEGDPLEFDPSLPLVKQPWPKYTPSKVTAMKFVTRVLFYSMASPLVAKSPETVQQLQKVVKSHFCILASIISSAGDPSESANLCAVEKARLRAVAGACILKLCYYWNYRKLLDMESFIYVSKLVEDEADCVRNYFVVRLRKGISRILPIEFGAFFCQVNFAVSANSDDGANLREMKSFRDGCRRLAHDAFTTRKKTTNSGAVDDAHRPIFDAENVVAYTVFLLAHHEGCTSNEDVRGLAELQECLWFVLEALIGAKCDMETVVQIFEELKKDGDTYMRDCVSSSSNVLRVTPEQLETHNKKMWALCDLGIAMMLYRAKVVVKDDRKKLQLSKNFFYRVKDSNPAEVYAPDELLTDEKRRNGRLPAAIRDFSSTKRKNNSSLSSGEATRAAPRRGLRKQKTSQNISIRSHSEPENSDDEVALVVKKRVTAAKPNRKKESLVSDSEDEEKVPKQVKKASRAESSKSGSKRMNSIETTRRQEEDEEQELGEPSTSTNGKNAEDDSETEPDEEKIVVSPIRGRREIKSKETVIENANEQPNGSEKNSTNLKKFFGSQAQIGSLENLAISPIVKEGKMPRRGAKPAALATSTPFRAEAKKSRLSKRKSAIPLDEEDEEEKISLGEPSPKRRTSDRKKIIKVSSPEKQPSSKKGPTKEVFKRRNAKMTVLEAKTARSPSKTKGKSRRK